MSVEYQKFIELKKRALEKAFARMNEKQREASYKQALQGCSGRDWISILKTLNQRKEERLAAGKKITALDERYLRVTEQELYGELSVVLGIEKENMHDYIQEQIAAL